MYPLTLYALSAVSGVLVGFALGLVGGGGSILAIPLLLYFAGLSSVLDQDTAVHVAIGTTSVAVGLNALANFAMHLKSGNAELKAGAVFAGIGTVASTLGALLGRQTKGQLLLALLGVAMVLLSFWVASKRRYAGGKTSLKRLAAGSALVGFVSGFLGIGGGFLVAPALLWAGLDVKKAIGTSLLAVGLFGLSTSAVYASAGYADYAIAAAYLAGGVLGGRLGVHVSTRAPREKVALAYSALIAAVGVYTVLKALG
ncbi:sulfite exporter TauE/SafE family protein [Thermofilum pendens]|uniref:Probable membrane transporter protein n=1 Tax=Thermofilum pendens (strain DSM 2475 / Hrk 5) TaxID=368408 RepID=A1RW81_THEPD|nr:sulfite exporter TauE/SafE family protein [Thermofilum pendens]ABL77461.1 protein of unknown function DUF81 [Thermofilum pendens Hrk 5]